MQNFLQLLRNCLISYVSGPVASHNSKVVLYITRIAVDGIHYCRAQVAIFDIPPIKSQLKILRGGTGGPQWGVCDTLKRILVGGRNFLINVMVGEL